MCSDARTDRGTVDIVFDVFDPFDSTYLIDHASEVPVLADDAAQRYLAASNGNVKASCDGRFRSKRLPLERGDIGLVEPDRNLDRDRGTVIGEHEVLQRLVTELVVADGRNDEGGCL